ncbi:MAG: VCBS repeat-containing protein [Planctomycetota bacterium]
MLSASLALALALPVPQDALFPATRIDGTWLIEAVDFDADGIDDFYSARDLVLSDGAFGVKAVLDDCSVTPLFGFCPSDARDHELVELNGDGVPDIVEANEFSDKVDWRLVDPFGLSVTWLQVFDLPSPFRVGAGDVDGDGAGDVVHVGITGGWDLLRGDGQGGLAVAQSGSFGGPMPSSVELGDFNGDSLADLTVAFVDGGLQVALADGVGLGVPAGLLADKQIRFLQPADLNADGDLDLAATGVDFVEVLLGDGAGGFSPQGPHAFSHTFTKPVIQVVDFDLAGLPDLVVGDQAECGASRLIVAHGDGVGGVSGLEEVELYSECAGFAFGDFDGDGDDDLAVHSTWNMGIAPFSCSLDDAAELVYFIERVGGELLLPRRVGGEASAFAVGDGDGDGANDVSVLRPGEVELLAGVGPSVAATLSVGLIGEEIRMPDLDADGTVDLVVFPSAADPAQLSLLRGLGRGAFAAEALHPFDGVGSLAAFADWTGDGLPDLFAPSRVDNAYPFYPGAPGPSFGAPVEFLPSGWDIFNLELGSIEPVDMDLDGVLDAVTVVDFPGVAGTPHVRVMHGDGTGGFVQAQSIIQGISDGHPGDTAAADFNLDGWPDVATNAYRLYFGQGDGLLDAVDVVDFSINPSVAIRTAELQAVDVDRDGLADLVTERGMILRGTAQGLEQPGANDAYFTYAKTDYEVADVVGNGAPDLLALVHDQVVVLEGQSDCSGAFATYGGGCLGSNGEIPALSGDGCPEPGGVYRLEVSRGLPGTPAFASFGNGEGALGLPNGCELLLNPWIPIFVGFTLDELGEGSLSIAVAPTSPPGVTSTAQVGLFDPGAQDFYTLTNGLAITVE